MYYSGLENFSRICTRHIDYITLSTESTNDIFSDVSEVLLESLGESLVKAGFPYEKTIPFKGVYVGKQIDNPIFWISKKRGPGGMELPLLRSNLRKLPTWKQNVTNPEFVDMVRKTIVCAMSEFKVVQELDIMVRDGKLNKSEDGTYSIVH